MRGIAIAVALCATVALRANEKPSAEYQDAMKALAAANQALRGHVKEVESAGAYPDYTLIEKDAAALKAAFGPVLAYWKARNVDDAVATAALGLKGVADLETAAKDKSYDALVTASTAIGATCGSCHMAHRERLADGTFEIK